MNGVVAIVPERSENAVELIGMVGDVVNFRTAWTGERDFGSAGACAIVGAYLVGRKVKTGGLRNYREVAPCFS